MLSVMGMEISGKLHVINEAQQVTERFRKREFVLELSENTRFPQFVIFQLTGDRCGRIDDFEVGNEVRVEFSLRGREWNSPRGEVKYFNSLDVRNIERTGGAQARDEEPPFSQEPPAETDDEIAF
ncbi:MAG: DUF3127 domain-containing protein [Deltaproteobacteria bacterium]|nr:DUF3127 domain-containing protein [Deltaproteobacteria bacterium]